MFIIIYCGHSTGLLTFLTGFLPAFLTGEAF